MRRTNINAVLKMVHEYLNGQMDEIDFWLDFSYEVTQRYQKMLQEDPELTDMIYVYLLENGTDLHDKLSEAEFYKLIQKQYNEVMDGVY